MSTMRGVGMYGPCTSTAHQTWSFYCCDAVPFISQGNSHVCFWLLFTSIHALTTPRRSVISMTSSARWRPLILMLFLSLLVTSTSATYGLYSLNISNTWTYPPGEKTLWTTFTVTYVVHSEPPPAPPSETRTTSLCFCTWLTDKDSSSRTLLPDRLSYGHHRLRALYRTVSPRRTGMFLELQPRKGTPPSA